MHCNSVIERRCQLLRLHCVRDRRMNECRAIMELMVANDGRNLGAALYAFHRTIGALESLTPFTESPVYCWRTKVSKLTVAISFIADTFRFAANWSAASFKRSCNKMRSGWTDFKISRWSDAIFKVVFCLRSQVLWWSREVVGPSARTFRKNKNRTRYRSLVP